MQSITLTEFKNEDYELLIAFMTSDTWPFHGSSNPSEVNIKKSIEEGFYKSKEVTSFWINYGDEIAGFIRLYDLEDETPMFDIRIKPVFRGKGIGEKALSLLVNYVLNEKGYRKLEGNTRVDNIAMRKVFKKCGFLKEAHHRQSWPDDDGYYHDCVGYGVLQEDLRQNKVTPVNWDDEP